MATTTPKRKLDPRVAKRQAIEKRIARAFAKTVIAAGHSLLIDNGGEQGEEVKTTTVAQTMKEMFATDEERVYVIDASGKNLGGVYFVYGNDGWDVIADYHTRLEDMGLLKDALALSEKLGG
jgi:hypothetical protein